MGKRPARRAPWATVIFAMVLLAVPPPLEFASPAAADHAEEVVAQFPVPRTQAATVWDGRQVLLFGGFTGDIYGTSYSDAILSFDPASGAVETKAARLPTPRRGAGAVWDGRYAYVFGGQQGEEFYRDILRYDPATDNLTVLAAQLPFAVSHFATVWTGTSALLFGGLTSTTPDWKPIGTSNAIVRFTPAAPPSGQVLVSSQGLPGAGGRMGPAAVWDGTHAYILGGQYEYWWGACVCKVQVTHEDLVRYDPVANTVQTLGPPALNEPAPRVFGATGFHDGSLAYFVGGRDRHSVLRLDTRNLTWSSGGSLGRFTAYAGAVWTGEAAYVLGGETQGFDIYSNIIRLPRLPVASFRPVAPAECLGGVGTVALDGSASRSLRGVPLALSWSTPDARAVFADAGAPRTALTLPWGVHGVSLSVTETYFDGSLVSALTRDVAVVDSQPPTSTVRLDGTLGTNGWHTSPSVRVTIAGSDACAMGGIVIDLDGATWRYDGPFDVTGEGIHTLTSQAYDAAGNAEAPRTQVIRIDSIAPTVALSRPLGGHLYAADADLLAEAPAALVVGPLQAHANATDGGSGVARVELLVDGAVRGGFANGTFLWAAWAEAAGPHQVEARAVDQAGNEARHGREVLTLPLTVEGALATAGLARCDEVFSPPVCAAVGPDPRALVAFVRSFLPSPEETCRAFFHPAVCANLPGQV